MVKAAKSYQQKYEKIMGESSEDELWSDIERDIAEFKKKVELGKADGYFWNMYFNLLRSNRLMFAGINEAFITGDMAYMLNGIYQENRFNCIYGNRANSGGAQTIFLLYRRQFINNLLQNFFNRIRNMGCIFIDPRGGISHSIACAGGLQHFHIVILVSEYDTVFCINM